MKLSNVFQEIPASLKSEVFDDLVCSPDVRIERIISKGHTSPTDGWYDQDENEWVILLDGRALIEFENGEIAALERGDYLNIESHCKHRVSWTDPERVTVWLAVFYKNQGVDEAS